MARSPLTSSQYTGSVSSTAYSWLPVQMGFVLGDRQGLEVRCKAKVREQTALVLLCKSVQSQLLLRSAQNTLVEPIRLLSESCCIDRPCSRHRNGFAATFLLLGDWIVHPRERCTTAFYQHGHARHTSLTAQTSPCMHFSTLITYFTTSEQISGRSSMMSSPLGPSSRARVARSQCSPDV